MPYAGEVCVLINPSSVKSRFALYIFLALILPVSSESEASSTKIYYAGFSFVGNYMDNQRLYPHSVELAKEIGPNQVPVLEQALARKIRDFSRSDIELIIDQVGDYRTGQAITLAFAVDWENVAVEQIDDLYKIVVDVHAQILLFDFSEMKVIGSFPVAVQVRDVSKEKPSDSYIQNIVRSIYLEDTYGVNIFEAFIQRLHVVPIKQSFGQYLRVASVVLEEKAIAQLPEDSYQEKQAFSTLVAQNFGKHLSLNQNVSLLPYTKGEAIGSKMALRFSNGDTVNLNIPEPDFVLDLTVRGFKKIKAGENRAKIAWVYGSFVRVTLKQPDFDRVYFDIPFKFTVVKEVPVTQKSVDDWSAFQESLFAFFSDFSRQVSDPSKKWLKKVTNAENVPHQFDEFFRILNKCR